MITPRTNVYYQPDRSGWGLYAVNQGGRVSMAVFAHLGGGDQCWFLLLPQDDGSFAVHRPRSNAYPANINAGDAGPQIGVATFEDASFRDAIRIHLVVDTSAISSGVSFSPPPGPTTEWTATLVPLLPMANS